MEIKNFNNLKRYYVGVFEGLHSIGHTYFTDYNTAEEKAEAAIKSGHWDVKVIYPSMASALNNLGYLNVGICPLCGDAPISKDRSWKYAWDWNDGTNLNLCQSCYRKGLRETGSGKSGCYIATVCYGSELSDNVISLKLYRDKILKNNKMGRYFVSTYYKASPYLANYLRNKKFVNVIIRKTFFNPLVKYIVSKYNFIPIN